MTPQEKDDEIILEAKRRFKACEEWEATARANFDYDYKFANADSINMYQWDSWVIGDRIANDRPCLTINKTKQHNLQIVNDGKQNKPGVNIRPVGDTASFEAAQIFQEVVRHIEYISNAETIYDNASEFQVDAGIGYWRVVTDYISDRSFDQEIYLKRVKDPRSVFLDPDINEVDGSDANFGFVFTDEAKDLYDAKYPKFQNVGGSAALFGSNYDSWYSNRHVRVCEYFRKNNKEDKFIWFVLPTTQEEVEGFWSELDQDGKDIFNEIKAREHNYPPNEQTFRERPVVRGEIEWYKIAGNVIIDRKPWLGKYIPLVRIIGRETIIDGVLDRIGHTRALLDPQRIYNINSSANVEFGALQSKVPIAISNAAVEGYEEYYRTANTVNHAWMPYNAYDEDGNKLDPPKRMEAPQSSPAYVQQMQIAQNEMMMVSGQYQAQMGENENAKSGVAINARQRQGDRATYHFIDGQAIGIRFTGKILIDLIPKIYDKKRIMRIESKDGTVINLTIDPNAAEAYKKVLPDQAPSVSNEQMIDVIFNPNVGLYTVQSDTGPSFATRRQEAFNALTQIAASNKDFMGIAGDILWKVADFPEAQLLSQRYRRIIPPNVLGDAPNPQMTEAMEQAAKQIEDQLATIARMTQEANDRTRELDIKDRQVELQENVAIDKSAIEAIREIREDYKAISDRLTALGNAGPGISIEQLQPLIKDAVIEALQNGQKFGEDENNMPGINEGGTPIVPHEESSEIQIEDDPPVEGAKKAKDGNWYVDDPDRPGKYLMVH